jgi:phage regulator Rha-like protein
MLTIRTASAQVAEMFEEQKTPVWTSIDTDLDKDEVHEKVSPVSVPSNYMTYLVS